MGKIAFVFSGQGAQKAGMGKTFYEANETVKKLFDDAEALREGTLRQCFEGTAEELKEKNISLSASALKELAVMESAVREIMEKTVSVFIDADLELALSIEPLEETIVDFILSVADFNFSIVVFICFVFIFLLFEIIA